MIYPKCPRDSDDACRFVQGASIRTSMWSPIQYARDGSAVAGGDNWTTSTLNCAACGNSWTRKRTELQQVQGVTVDWTLNRQDADCLTTQTKESTMLESK